MCLDKDSITYSKPKKTFKDWRLQKARHLSTAPLYTGSSKSFIAFNYFSQYFFHLSVVALFFSMKTLLLIPILLILKMIVQLIALNKVCNKLNERELLLSGLLYELILLFIYPIFHVTKLFYKPGKWSH